MTAPPNPGDAQIAGGKKVLLVEDEEALANALRLKLGAQKFDVTWAKDGQEALDEINQGKYDVIVTDLILPVMDGFTMMQKLQEKKDGTPVIVLSNLGQPEDIEHAKSLGAKEFLVKSNVPLARIPEYINKAIM